MAKPQKYSRFAPTGSSRIKRAGSKINRRRPRYIRGSAGKTVRVGLVGPEGAFAGIHAGILLRSRSEALSITSA